VAAACTQTCIQPTFSVSIALLLRCSVAALPNSGYWKIGAYYAGALVFYLFFSLPMSYVKHSRVDFVDEDYTCAEPAAPLSLAALACWCDGLLVCWFAAVLVLVVVVVFTIARA
jgi:hypothetical protein